MNPIAKTLRPLASAAIFYYTTLWLVSLVVVGTIAQKYFGLQASLEKYFSAWFIQPMEMPIWLPSGRFTMALILVNLTAKMLFSTKWKWKMAGINITHLGVMILMIGGVMTAYTTIEGNLAIQEGKSSSVFKDFHQLELAVTDHSDPEFDHVTTFSEGFFTEGNTFSDSKVPFTFKVQKHHKNCEPVERTQGKQSPRLKQHATRYQFEALPPDKQDQNAGGIEVEITGVPAEAEGIYLFYFDPRRGGIATTIQGNDGKDYSIQLRPRQYELPFSVHLKDFEKLDHAGTMMARAYSSKVTVTDGDSKDDIKIYMNHPLRRHGYTLYQASFIQPNQSGIETSVFQVVYNKGRYMPYIAIAVITLGLLVHLCIQIPKLLSASAQKPTIGPKEPTKPTEHSI
ncbi:cytochrome c biogenesis protein ResB [Verrucomicrobiaceae bacterium N1E253]|uniref:Cytochrome c biogenesis protein ResB n=1 Tax=Oceaniferula marina TaxID=2748318 RepID=A0A851GJM5_9BACT|nr:cytochrome c biogenesis protein ResB [Oceaniferula marina]NWK54890.1 cytochrome c biogenesis protein ResB [Oceaniferula marina]